MRKYARRDLCVCVESGRKSSVNGLSKLLKRLLHCAKNFLAANWKRVWEWGGGGGGEACTITMRRHCQNWQINLEINFVFVFYYLRTKQTKGNNKGNKSNNNNKGSCNESRCLLTALTLSCLYLPLSSPLSPSLTPACLQSFTFCVLHFWVNYFSSLLLLFCCSFCCCCCCCCWLYTRDIHMQAKLRCTFGPFYLSLSL